MNDGSSSAAAGPEVRVVSLSLPILVTHGLHTAATAAVATERAGVPERPVEPVELLQAPRTRDAAAGLRVVGAAAATTGIHRMMGAFAKELHRLLRSRASSRYHAWLVILRRRMRRWQAWQ